MNRVILGGRLTHDPELKMTPSGVAMTSFGIAVSRRNPGKDEKGERINAADFLTVVAWRERAELICRYFSKGSSIAIVGSIQTRSFTTGQGEKRYATEIVADEVYFVDSKAESEGRQERSGEPGYMPGAYQTAPSAMPSAPAFETVEDEELPF